MKDYIMEEFIWVEKYRPKSIESCVLPNTLKETLKEFISQGDVPNLILSGGPGIGKTTAARAMLDELGLTYMFINGSEESGIDVLRTKIKNFASTVSLHGGRKYLILDEADYLNPQSTQPALRGFIEEFSKNCGFILTCNYKNRIISPLHSRCSVVDFTIPKSEKQELAGQFFDRVLEILNNENIKYERKVVSEVIMNFFPDWRRVINEMQRYSASGRIDAGILVDISEVNIKELMHFMKNKEFSNVKKWIVNSLDNDPTRLFRRIYDNLYNHLDGSSIPHVVVILGDYQYKAAFVADQEINMLACFTEIMARGKFK
jgi:DNA polymerase III delta prime subunit